MSMTRNIYGLALVALAGTAVSAAPTAKDANTTRDAIGQSKALVNNLQGGPATTGDFDLVFDNMTDADSTTGYNVSYVNLGSYDGTDPSSNAYLVGMCSIPGGFFDAPAHPDSGIPTDIWYDEYAADPAAWVAAPGTLQSLNMIDFIPVICPANAANPGTYDHILFWGNVNFDGDMFRGAIQITWASVSSAYCGWFGATGIDLLGGAINYDIDDVGWVILDWRQDQMVSDEGAGHMIAGGDLLDPLFPTPDEQWTLGETDFTSWIASDGVTGVDPSWDGDPGDTSYMDVLNTGDNINWAFVDPLTNPVSELAHDFPFRLYVSTDGGSPCPGDLNGDGQTDQSDLGILLASFEQDAGGDLNGDGVTDQSDLGILLADWECGL